MFLLWAETTMRDLIVLKEGGEEMRMRYSESFGNKTHPADFARSRLEIGKLDFGKVKERFLNEWPDWRNHREVNDAIERIVIWRNALGHANVQPFRGYLLYTPPNKSMRKIDRYTRCDKCYKFHECCNCHREHIAEPYSLVVDTDAIKTIFQDIRTVDIHCLYPTAVYLNVDYRGIAWMQEDRQYLIKENRRN